MNETEKKQLAQLFILGCIVVGFIILRNDRRKKALLLQSGVSDMPPAPPATADVVNPNSNTDNVTPVDTYNIVKDSVTPVADLPVSAPPVQPVVMTQQEMLVANLWNAVNAGQQETNLEKATRFLVMKNIDPSSLEDSTPQGIVNYAFANGWNPNA